MTVDRKAELFDGLLSHLTEIAFDADLIMILRRLDFTDDEIKEQVEDWEQSWFDEANKYKN